MIGNIPASVILEALDAECKMLEDDVKHSRLKLTGDALSIFCFRGFVQMVKRGNVLRCATDLPPEHIEFYKETVIRLIRAGELPSSAVNEFDWAFIL